MFVSNTKITVDKKLPMENYRFLSLNESYQDNREPGFSFKIPLLIRRTINSENLGPENLDIQFDQKDRVFNVTKTRNWTKEKVQEVKREYF